MKKAYVSPGAEPLHIATEHILEDSNEGGWMPLNIVKPSVKDFEE